MRNVERWVGNSTFSLIEGDLLNPKDLSKLDIGRYEIIFHLAANPEVRVGSANPEMHFQQNVVATKKPARTSQESGKCLHTRLHFVIHRLRRATKIPTPEDYAPLKPISVYGASKLASEALISAYAHTYGFKAIIYRLANVVGPRSRHGVIHDFIQKLRANPMELEILGDGTQTKSYFERLRLI